MPIGLRFLRFAFRVASTAGAPEPAAPLAARASLKRSAARSRVALICESLEQRDTPSVSALQSTVGTAGMVHDSPAGAVAELSMVQAPSHQIDANTVMPDMARAATHITRSSTTTLTASTHASTFGQYVTFTATVVEAGTSTRPSGKVTFKDGGTILETVPLVQGRAALSWGHLSVGTHTITAVYTGASGVRASWSTSVSVTVSRAPLKLSAPIVKPANARFNGPVTLSVHSGQVFTGATANRAGTVTFKDGNAVLGKVQLRADGLAQLTIRALAPGSHRITAVYSGNAHFLSSSSPTTPVTVPPKGSPPPVHQGPGPTQGKSAVRVTLQNLGEITTANSALLFLVTVKSESGSGTPGGFVTIMDGSTSLGTFQLNKDGQAALGTAVGLSAGQHTLSAVYEGNGSFAAGSTSIGLRLT
jgi:hypothetical protein